MNRQFYLDLAQSGLCMPIAADLVLHEKPKADRILTDGRALGQAGHPFILGSECDVLHVPGAADMIAKKVDAFVNCACN